MPGRLVNWRFQQTPKYPWSKTNLDKECCPFQETIAFSLERPPEGVEPSHSIQLVFDQITKHHSLQVDNQTSQDARYHLTTHLPPCRYWLLHLASSKEMKCRFHKYYNYKDVTFFLNNTSFHAPLFMKDWNMLERGRASPNRRQVRATFAFGHKIHEFHKNINCHPTKHERNPSGILKDYLATYGLMRTRALERTLMKQS